MPCRVWPRAQAFEKPLPMPPSLLLSPRASSLLGFRLRKGLKGGLCCCALGRLCGWQQPLASVSVLAWVGFQSIVLDHLWAIDLLWAAHSLPPPIGNPSRKQSAKAKRSPRPPSGDWVTVLMDGVLPSQNQTQCSVCTLLWVLSGLSHSEVDLGIHTPCRAFPVLELLLLVLAVSEFEWWSYMGCSL